MYIHVHCVHVHISLNQANLASCIFMMPCTHIYYKRLQFVHHSFSPVVIGFVQTSLTVSETDGSVTLEIRLMEGVIAPQLGDIVVTASSSDRTATGIASCNVAIHRLLMFLHVCCESVSSFHSITASLYAGCEIMVLCVLISEHRDVLAVKKFRALAS